MEFGVRGGDFDRWTACAAPAMLELIRRSIQTHASAPLRKPLRGEVASELVKVPTDDLASHLVEVVPR